MHEIIFQDALFRCHLGTGIDMLKTTPAARAEVWTSGRYTPGPRLENLINLRQLETGFLAIGVVRYHFTGQRTFNEDDFTLGMGNATPFLIKGFDENSSSHIYIGPDPASASVREQAKIDE
jgi:hypothetical protein